MLAFDSVNSGLFNGPFVADASFDQNLFCSRIDENAVHVHPNPVLIVRRADLRPQVAWNHSKHGTAVETKLGVRNDFHAVVADLHGYSRKLFQAKSPTASALPVALSRFI